MNLQAQLCLVKLPWAWFTTCQLDRQWGDDWNDAPYDCNAGYPYAWQPQMAQDNDSPIFEYAVSYTHLTLPTN